MSNYCTICETNHIQDDEAYMLVLGNHWLEFCAHCGARNGFTDSVSSQFVTLLDIFTGKVDTTGMVLANPSWMTPERIAWEKEEAERQAAMEEYWRQQDERREMLVEGIAFVPPCRSCGHCARKAYGECRLETV